MDLNNNLPLENDIGFFDRYVKNKGRRYVYGRTNEAASFINIVGCDFVIDDFTEEKFFNGKRIVRLDDVPNDASVLAAVIHSPVSIYKKLENKKVDFSSYYWIQENEDLDLPEIKYWKGGRGHFYANESKYSQLYQDLSDAESRLTMIDLLSFRETGNIRNMFRYPNRLDEMYFENFLSLPSNASFYDLGALDGKNSLGFIKKYPDFSGLVLVEPLPVYAKKLRNLFESNISKVYECAISDSEGFANFNISVCDAASSLSKNKEQGDLIVKVKTIDQIYYETKLSPSFIKMDIEGAEIEALRGADSVINEFKPALAISVYHDPAHLLEAYELLKSKYQEYKFFIRHYSEGFAETVLFAVA
jgi:FkbM family methyltransferase